MGLECSSQEGTKTPCMPSCMVAQGKASKEPKDVEVKPQISSKEELEEVNLRVDLWNPRFVLISSQL